jgi:hypothetical protein
MNAKLTNFVKNTKGYLCKHSPEILTGIGVTGMITSTVLAVKATPKALLLLDVAEHDKGEALTVVETVKVAWKPYIPAIVTGAVSVACILGASAVNSKRNAALATAYAISERSLLTYRDKVIETIGEKKEKEIRQKVAQEEVNNNPVNNSQVIITSKGNSLCMDSLFGRYFKSDIDQLKKCINELNREIITQNYASLNSFYSLVGLDPVEAGNRLGWNIDDRNIELTFSACLTENDEPCIVVDFRTPPKYDFDRFF